jgi:adenosylmethionine-8-amino-7-oxononanoate aminotransferase
MTRARDTRLWHSQARMADVRHAERVIVRGEGAYVWDEDGNRLLDATASLWYCNVGHGRAEIADAVDAQMRTLEAYHTFQQYATRPALEIAERVAAMTPVDDPRVFLTSGGSDSVDAAAKLARRYWHVRGRDSKKTIITRELSYHGLHGFGTSIAGLEFNLTGQGELIRETALVPTNDAAALERLVAELGADSIAAFYSEPILGTGGVIHPAEGYLAEAQRICRENEILFVADEVITGFGRAGAMFASERFGVRPDIMLLAKGITSGYMPLGAVVIAEPVWAPFWEQGSKEIFHHGITYSGHASACAAALANIDILEREQLPDRVRSLEGPLADRLRPLAEHELVKEVRVGIGLLAAIELHDPSISEDVARRCVEAGVLTRTIAGGALHVSPPFVVTESDLDLLANVLGEALDAAAS